MSDAAETVTGKWATIRFDGRLCIHSRGCVLAEPAVFKANVQGPWIDPDGASAEELMRVAVNCPSGAIRVMRHDGGAQEGAPKVNTITVRENGPLAIHAEIEVAGERTGTRATLCRCGQSNNKPYCDGSHAGAGFVSTGEPPTATSAALAKRDGVLSITPTGTDRSASPARSKSSPGRGARSTGSNGLRSAAAVTRGASRSATAAMRESDSAPHEARRERALKC
jgi:CDGSH-type Zn-finger protein/uncharacterized Fe-S cluster protein YjdI